MIRNLVEFVSGFFKALILGAMLFAAAAIAVTVAFFTVMTAYRGIELLWREVFSHSWRF